METLFVKSNFCFKLKERKKYLWNCCLCLLNRHRQQINLHPKSWQYPLINYLDAHIKEPENSEKKKKNRKWTKKGKLRALVLTPTRELAVQVKNHIEAIAKYTDIKAAVIVGGMAVQKQIRYVLYSLVNKEIRYSRPLWNLKGAFNNYVDQFWPNFDPLPPLEWTSVDILHPPPPCSRGQKMDKSPPPLKFQNVSF